MSALTVTTDVLQLLGEPTRVRLLALLARHELTVADLVGVLDLAQSRVSQHLKKLRDAGLLRDRREGTSTFYALSPTMPADALEMWTLLERRLDDTVLASDRARAEGLIAARKRGDRYEALAGEMGRHYSPGRTWESLARALVPLLSLGDVLDAGSGAGTIAELLLAQARSVTCLDASARMVAAVDKRLARAEHARAVVGDVRDMPFPAASFDRVLLFNVLVFVDEPARALSEAHRVLRHGGEVVVVTIDQHDHRALAREWGHVHPGFSPTKLRGLLRRAAPAGGTGAFEVLSCDVTSRERREPHLSVVTALARKP
jgi:ArsR family transcriptional regulator